LGPLGNWGLLYTPTAVIIAQAILIFPIMMNLTIAAVNSADPRLVPTLISLGARPYTLTVHVIRATRYAILAALITGFGRAIGEVGAAMMLGGNIQGFTRTMTTAIALETSKGEFELGLALGLLLLIIAFALNFALSWLNRS
jgi:tungstate transport system permease protein